MSAAVPDTSPNPDNTDATDPASTLQAVSENESADTDPEPHPWSVEPVRKVVPPPQFADAREKFDNTLARLEGDMMMSLIKRNRAIRARGGKGTMEDVVCDIRDNF